jgi:teichuronic acid biosynthesis glycosyltransferase TuaG
MKPPPYFSVIIPAFNAELFLRDAVHSVLSQTDSDLELIVIDDGSTDHTGSVVKDLCDARTRVISRPNSGCPAIPRNLGVQNATGSWIAFLDADDAWPLTKLAVFRQAIERHPDSGLFFSNGVVIDASSHPHCNILPFSKRLERLKPADELLVLSNYIPLSSVVVRRSLLGVDPFDARRDLRAVEDYFLWLQLNRRTPFHFIPRPLLYKRIHSANISGDRTIQLQRLHAMLDYIQESGAYPRDLVRLSRIIYDARYQPGFRTRFTVFRSLASAFLERPIQTLRRVNGLLAIARDPAASLSSLRPAHLPSTSGYSTGL